MLLTGRPLGAAGVLALVAAQVPAQARPDRPDTPEIRTAATVQRGVPPDLATVTLQFTADGTTPRQAGGRLAAKADGLRRALGTLGLSRDSLVNRSHRWWWNGRLETLRGPERCVVRSTAKPGGPMCDPVRDTTYRAHDAIEVRIRDLSTVGAVLDTATGRGITDISSIQFFATDVTAPEEEALREATIGARRQAEAIAAASGLQLGRVLSLGTQSDYAERFRVDDFAAAGVTGAADATGERSPTVVVRPSVPVAVTVYGRWELITKRP